MNIPSAWSQVLDFFGTPLVIEPSPGQLSGDAGLLPIRQFDERIGLTRDFAAALDDPRHPELTEHTFLEMVRSRVYGIPTGYPDSLPAQWGILPESEGVRTSKNVHPRARTIAERASRPVA